MKIFLSALLISVGLLAGTALAASNGDNNGKPFQELQAAVDAAVAAEAAAREAADAAEASAREAADSAEETARIAGDNAEAAARAAEDAALSAAITAETAARMAADLALQAEIEAQEALLLGLDGRVSVLEGLHASRSVTYTETAAFDLPNLVSDIAGLGYQPGEWFAIIGRNAGSGAEYGMCSNHASVDSALDAITSGYYFGGAHFNDLGSFYLLSGVWNPDLYLGWHAQGGVYPYLQIHSGWLSFAVIDRTGIPAISHREIYVNGNGLGNTVTINVGTTRLEACGF